MPENAITDLVGKVESQSVFLEYIDDPEALFVMSEAARIEGIEDLLAGVAEGRVTQVVSNRYGPTRSSLRDRALQMVRAICETSRVWVSLVR